MPPTLVVRRAYTLLPAPRHALDITETDAVPSGFMEQTSDSLPSNNLAMALSAGRPATRLTWKSAQPNLSGSSADWENWISSLMKEGRSNAPLNVQGQMIGWLSSAFRLVCANDDLWTVPLGLVGFDASLATHLENAMALSADSDFSRRLRALDKAAAMSVGKHSCS